VKNNIDPLPSDELKPLELKSKLASVEINKAKPAGIDSAATLLAGTQLGDINGATTTTPSVTFDKPKTPLKSKSKKTSSGSKFAIGDKIESRYGGKSKYYGGTIAQVKEDEKYEVVYDDGDKEVNVDESLIREVVTKAKKQTGSSKFTVGDEIEARYGGKSNYYGGTIAEVKDDGKYEIVYADGDKETSVDESLIREVATKEKSPIAVKTTEEEDVDSAANILAKKSPKKEVKEEDIKTKTATPPSKPKTPKTPSTKQVSKKESTTPIPKREKKEKAAPPVVSQQNSDDEMADYISEKEKKRKKKLLSNSQSSSLTEARCKQRLAYQRMQSMNANVKIPNENEYPLLHAAATGDLKSLGKFADKFTMASANNVAALRADKSGVTALHYSAYFHQKGACKLLLNSANEKIRDGISSEIDELIQKRTRFFEETK